MSRSFHFRKALDLAPDVSALLKELKSFASQSRKSKSFPSFLPADAASVTSGRKLLLENESTFNFSCTSCGACCRSLPDSVLLDPHDYSLIVGSKLEVASNPLSFRQVFGLFELSIVTPNDEKHVKITDDWIVTAKTTSGVSPVLFLRSSDVQNEVDNRCAFSAVDSSSTSSSTKLICTLGPASMPYACSLYPLGDFFQSSVSKKSFFSQDSAKNCEGISLSSSSSSTTTTKSSSTTVNKYIERNNLKIRQDHSEWFRRLATANACGGFAESIFNYFSKSDTHSPSNKHNPRWRERLPDWAKSAANAKEAVESFHNKTRQIWYRNEPFHTWEETQNHIVLESRALHDSINNLNKV